MYLEDESGNDEGKDDLALLVLDDEDDSKHFNYKTIVEEETMVRILTPREENYVKKYL